MMELLYLLIGLIIGLMAAWLIAKYKYTSRTAYLPLAEIQEQYVLRELFDSLQVQSDLYRDDLLDKESELRNKGNQLAARDQQIQHLEERLLHQKDEISGLQKQFQTEFENIANKLLEEKSRKFSLQNQQQLHDILMPLREQIKSFESGIEKRYIDETKDKVSLRKEIEFPPNPPGFWILL
ncbi:MAG: hypothetical protein AAFV25_00090 [Bacteroidota bacterium]